MKKHHRKAIQSQANYLVKIYSKAKGWKKTITLPGGMKITYSRKERGITFEHNGPLYMEGNMLKDYIKGLSVQKKAKLLRHIFKDLVHIHYNVRSQQTNRQYPINGCCYLEKQLAYNVIRSI
ncbi:hypothetical protein [Flavobacterium sp.]|uniref:hypothetical protein n=1 Tax=Flavobacterium sp. TaxID=239 RepID=UPI0037BFAA33